jgi:hypothetical protein
MLFHTYLFIFAFLPLTLLAFHLAAGINAKLPIFVLIVASLGFCAYWKPEVAPLLARQRLSPSHARFVATMANTLEAKRPAAAWLVFPTRANPGFTL